MRVQVVRHFRLAGRQLVRRLSEGTIVSHEDMAAVLIRLASIIRDAVATGVSVQLPGLGTLQLTVGSGLVPAGTANPTGKIRSKRIMFRADPDLKSALVELQFEQAA